VHFLLLPLEFCTYYRLKPVEKVKIYIVAMDVLFLYSEQQNCSVAWFVCCYFRRFVNKCNLGIPIEAHVSNLCNNLQVSLGLVFVTFTWFCCLYIHGVGSMEEMVVMLLCWNSQLM